MFSPPYNIFVDFFAITKSTTRDDACLLHPSVATAFNKNTWISTLEDAEKLISEFKDPNLYENVLIRHHLVRTLDMQSSLISSNVQIQKIVCMWAYVDPI